MNHDSAYSRMLRHWGPSWREQYTQTRYECWDSFEFEFEWALIGGMSRDAAGDFAGQVIYQ